jgi:hypothetical protein
VFDMWTFANFGSVDDLTSICFCYS